MHVESNPTAEEPMSRTIVLGAVLDERPRHRRVHVQADERAEVLFRSEA